MHVNHSQINSSKKCGFESHDRTKGFHRKTARQNRSQTNNHPDNHLFGNSVCVVTIHLFLTLKTRHKYGVQSTNEMAFKRTVPLREFSISRHQI